MERCGETQELFVRQRGGFVQVEGALAQGLAVRSQDLFLRGVADGAVQLDAVAEEPVQDALLPLVQGIIGIPGVVDFDDVAFHGTELLLQESGEVHLAHEADALGVLLFRRREVRLLGDAPHFRLGDVPDGEERLPELRLGELAQEIGLVLVGVRAFQQPVERLAVLGEDRLSGGVQDGFLAAVVAGGDIVGPVFLRDGEEGVELDLPVAQDVRVRGAALGVLVEHIVHDPLAVLLGQVHEIERDADLAGDELRHEAVLLPLAVAVEGGVGLVPVLHEHGEDVVALLLQEEGGDGGVHAAGQADADFDFAIFRGGSCHFVRFSPAKVMISKNISYF